MILGRIRLTAAECGELVELAAPWGPGADSRHPQIATLPLAGPVARVAELAGIFADRADLDTSGECSAQALKYQTGQQMGWHRDCIDLPSHRDIAASALVLLSRPSDFLGGRLQFRDPAGLVETIPASRGAVVVFRSDAEHRVTPVTRGERLSATWFLRSAS